MTEQNSPPANDNKQNPGSDMPATAAAVKEKKPGFSGSRGRRGVFIERVFSIIILGSVVFIGYMLYEQDKAIDVLFEQQSGIISQRNETSEGISQLQADLGNLDSALIVTREENTALVQERTAQITADMATQIDRLQNELVSTRMRITSNNPGASQEWLLAEAASLLRLAEQHLVVARNVSTAQALFIAADDVLKQVDDPAIFSVREILAGELAAIRSVNEVDRQDIYLQLGALAEQAGRLQMNNDLAVQIAEGEKVTLTGQGNDEAGQLFRMYSSLMNTLNNYLVVRRRDVPIQPLMTPVQEAALMQTVQLQIEQGRTALLKEEQEIYTASLGKARDNIDRFLSGPSAVKANIVNTLDDLRQRRIVTEAPPLSRTRTALEQILSASQDKPAGAVIQE